MQRTKKQLNTFEIENIQRKVALDIKEPVRTAEQLERFLVNWWCRHYNKPYKCKEVKEYTLEELIYEYYDINYRSNSEILEQYLSGETSETKEDEEWLKNMMGDGYMSKEKQEKQLHTMKEDIDAAVKEAKAEEEFSVKFKEFE